LYAGWHGSFYSADQFGIAFTFTTLFFAAFAAVPWIERSGVSSPPVILVVLANAATYFLEVYELFEHGGGTTLTAWAAVGLGTVYLVLGHVLSDRPALIWNVHWSIGIVLLIVAVPIGFESHWITIGWFAESGALLWISRRPRADFLKYLGGVALGLGVMRLLIIDNFDVNRLLLNHRIATFGFAIAVLVFAAKAVAGFKDANDRRTLPVLIVVINVLALFALNQEIADAFRRQVVRDFAYSALWIGYGAALMAVGFWKRSAFLRWQALVLIGVTIGKVFLYDMASLDRGYRIISFIALGLLLLTTSFLYQRAKATSTRTTSGAVSVRDGMGRE
ncbi:MAG: DUF2339 domain-containing protein, partial [Acidobacteria bacterium]|nr:DUF2339 domain-containing protein [Acidobacteriota bacterium]